MQNNYLEIKYQLAKRDKTLTWLAKMVGISLPYLIDILKGKRTPKARIEQINYFLKAEGII